MTGLTVGRDRERRDLSEINRLKDTLYKISSELEEVINTIEHCPVSCRMPSVKLRSIKMVADIALMGDV